MALESDVRTVVTTALEGSTEVDGVEVDSVTITPAGKRRVARVAIDRQVVDLAGDTSIESLTLDDIADATRVIGDALDASDVMGSQAYTLEVSTPGVDRPLTEPGHYRRNVGRLVTVTLDGEETATGRILETTAEGIVLQTPATKKTAAVTQEFPYTAVSSGRVEIEFNRPSPPDGEGGPDLPTTKEN